MNRKKIRTVNKEIEKMLAGNVNLLAYVLIKLAERQTEDEREEMATKYKNKIGFSVDDAADLTATALAVQRVGMPNNAKKIKDLAKRLSKYSGQIEDILSADENYKEFAVKISKHREFFKAFLEELEKIKEERYKNAIKNAEVTIEELNDGKTKINLKVAFSTKLKDVISQVCKYDYRKKSFYTFAHNIAIKKLLEIFSENSNISEALNKLLLKFNDPGVFDVKVSNNGHIYLDISVLKQLKIFYKSEADFASEIGMSRKNGMYGPYYYFSIPEDLEKIAKAIENDSFTQTAKEKLSDVVNIIDEADKLCRDSDINDLLKIVSPELIEYKKSLVIKFNHNELREYYIANYITKYFINKYEFMEQGLSATSVYIPKKKKDLNMILTELDKFGLKVSEKREYSFYF